MILNPRLLKFKYITKIIMKNILILWSLPQNQEDKKLYEDIILICNRFGKKVLSPIDTSNFEWTEKERYIRAFESVKWADIIIWEQSNPSTWQWMEIRESSILAKPLLVIGKTGSKISGLVKWSPNLKEIIYYENIKDLEKKLSNFLEEIKKSS